MLGCAVMALGAARHHAPIHAHGALPLGAPPLEAVHPDGRLSIPGFPLVQPAGLFFPRIASVHHHVLPSCLEMLRQDLASRRLQMSILRHDRHGHAIARLYDPAQQHWLDEVWTERGWAVYGGRELPRAIADRCRARERQRQGFWQSGTFSHLHKPRNIPPGFHILTETIQRVRVRRDFTFLNLGPSTLVVIPKAQARRLREDLGVLIVGMAVEVRGWFHQGDQARLVLTDAAALTLGSGFTKEARHPS